MLTQSEGGQPLLPASLDARNQLVTANHRLACAIAKRFTNRGLDLEDLTGIAYFGLVIAAEKWDPARGRFSVCASIWIRHYLGRALEQESRMIRLPSRVYSDRELAAKCARVSNSLDGLLPSGRRYGDLLPDPADSPQRHVERAEQAESVRRALAQLSGQQRAILTLRYGFDGGGARSRAEVGLMVKLSAERVRQVESAARKKLKPLLEPSVLA